MDKGHDDAEIVERVGIFLMSFALHTACPRVSDSEPFPLDRGKKGVDV